MSFERLVDTWTRFDELVLELELQLRVVLRRAGAAIPVIDCAIVLLEAEVPKLQLVVGEATALLVATRKDRPAWAASGGSFAAGRRVAMMSLVLGNRAFALTFARQVRKLRGDGRITEALALAWMAQALGVAPADLPVEQWVDAVVPAVKPGGVEA